MRAILYLQSGVCVLLSAADYFAAFAAADLVNKMVYFQVGPSLLAVRSCMRASSRVRLGGIAFLIRTPLWTRAWCKIPWRDSAPEAASDASIGNHNAPVRRPCWRLGEPVRSAMSERPQRGRSGEREQHWDPAHFTWDPYEAKAEPRSGEVPAEAQRSGGSGGASGTRRRGSAGATESEDPAEEPAAPGPSPGMEDVPSLDPSYDLSGVQKKSVPMVCQARGATGPPNCRWAQTRTRLPASADGLVRTDYTRPQALLGATDTRLVGSAVALGAHLRRR